jgi:hypothetical protein
MQQGMLLLVLISMVCSISMCWSMFTVHGGKARAVSLFPPFMPRILSRHTHTDAPEQSIRAPAPACVWRESILGMMAGLRGIWAYIHTHPCQT